MQATKANHSKHYTEIFRYFLKLGFLGFGGPFAVMASLQKDLVDKRKWISGDRFAQAVALIKALPGPMATQLSIYCGFVRGGRIGGILAGTGLILPSFILMTLLAMFYQSISSLTWSEPALFGMQAAAIGVIFESVWKLTAAYRREILFWILVVIASAATLWRPSAEPIVIIGFGLLGMAIMRAQISGKTMPAILPPLLLAGAGTAALSQLAGVAVKAGAFVFGSGLAIVPMLAHDVVDKYHWLTNRQFLDALAFGQITPGPVVITITFIGYRVAGLAGAVVGTIGIFAPAFFNILSWFPVAERKFGYSPYAKRFVMWAIAAVVGSITIAVGRLGIATATEGTGTYPAAIGLAVLAFILTMKTRLPVWIIIPGAGAATALVHTFL